MIQDPEPLKDPRIPICVLDKGYLKLVSHMGEDQTIIEAARMSTDGGFRGWVWEEDTYADSVCPRCGRQYVTKGGTDATHCTTCGKELQELQGVPPKLMGKKGENRDQNLLEYLYRNKHFSPFEMCELSIEVKVPIFVAREWQRHRTQSYNEFSSRYSVLPPHHYVPDPSRIRSHSKLNNQGSGERIRTSTADTVSALLEYEQNASYKVYTDMIELGLTKELARLTCPVSMYSKMRVKANLRNWLAFLDLRMRPEAQFEIVQYARAVASIIQHLWPRTYKLFSECTLRAIPLHGTEVDILKKFINQHKAEFLQFPDLDKASPSVRKRLISKLSL